MGTTEMTGGQKKHWYKYKLKPKIKPEIKTTLHLKSMSSELQKNDTDDMTRHRLQRFFDLREEAIFFYIQTTKRRREIGDREWGVTCSKGPELRPYDQIYRYFVQDWRGSVLIPYWQKVLIYILPLGSEAQEWNILKKEKKRKGKRESCQRAVIYKPNIIWYLTILYIHWGPDILSVNM